MMYYKVAKILHAYFCVYLKLFKPYCTMLQVLLIINKKIIIIENNELCDKNKNKKTLHIHVYRMWYKQ